MQSSWQLKPTQINFDLQFPENKLFYSKTEVYRGITLFFLYRLKT